MLDRDLHSKVPWTAGSHRHAASTFHTNLEASAPLIADHARRVNLVKDREERAEIGQFLTPLPVATLMASMFEKLPESVRLLDPGAGSGALTAAFVAEMVNRAQRPRHIDATCYEIDPDQRVRLQATLDGCRAMAHLAGIAFTASVNAENFIRAGAVAAKLEFGCRYDAVIMNPPYRKIGTASAERQALRSIGIETVNLYTGFMAIACKLLDDGGQLVVITPRSFCNGPYYRPFRQAFLAAMSLRRIHVFGSRSAAFGDDAVLQENIITAAVRESKPGQGQVIISESEAVGSPRSRTIRHDVVVRANDPELFIHIQTNADADQVSGFFTALPLRMADLGLSVSTGPVVDFRLRDDLCNRPGTHLVPLYWPGNCRNGASAHPILGKKPQWIRKSPSSQRWLSPNERFVLIKRFSSKEERRRVVAVVHDPASVDGPFIAMENHLNFIHRNGHGLPPDLAAGIAAYLNSGLVDVYFRQFNGHTQVNATDLRALPFPASHELELLGRQTHHQVTDPVPGDNLIRRLAQA